MSNSYIEKQYSQGPSFKVKNINDISIYSKHIVEDSPKQLQDSSFELMPESMEFRSVKNPVDFLNQSKKYVQTSKKQIDFLKNNKLSLHVRKSKQNNNTVNMLQQQLFLQRTTRNYIEEIFLRIKSRLSRVKFEFINDVTAYFDIFQLSQNLNSKFTKSTISSEPICLNHINKRSLLFKQFFEKINTIPSFKRDSTILLFWNILNALIKICCIFWFTISQFFIMDQFECSDIKLYNNVYCCVILLLLLSIMIKLNKIYIQNGTFIEEKSKIAEYYFKNQCFQDILCILPLIMSLYDLSQCKNKEIQKPLVLDYRFFINLLILIMFKDFFDSIEEVFRQLKMQVKQKMIAELGKLIILIILIAHIFACSLKFISEFELTYLDYKQTWILHYDLIFQPWYIQYIYSFYWSTTIMITVGFGDFTAQTPLEACFIVLVMLIGCGIFGFAINKIGGIVNELNQSKINLQNDQDALTNYLTEKKLNSDIIQRSIAYLEYFHSVKHSTDEEKQIIKKLPPNLQEEISNQINQKVIGNFSILVNNFSKQTIDRLMQKVNEQMTSPGQIIISPNDKEQNLYYLLEGEINLVYYPVAIQNLIELITYKQDQNHFYNQSSTRQTVIKVNKSNLIGTNQFFTGKNSPFVATSKTYCKLYYIKRSDFVDIVRFNQDDLEIFYNLIDCEKQDNLCIKIRQCQSCSSIQHNLEDCPSIHLNVNKVKYIQREMYRPQKQVKEFKRISHKRGQTLIKLQNTQQWAKEIRDNFSHSSIQISLQQLDESEELSENEIYKLPSRAMDEQSHQSIEERIQNPSKLILQEKINKIKQVKSQSLNSSLNASEEELFAQQINQKNPIAKKINKVADQRSKYSNASHLSNNNNSTGLNYSHNQLNDKGDEHNFQIDRQKEFQYYKIRDNFSNVMKLYQKQMKKVIQKKKPQYRNKQESLRYLNHFKDYRQNSLVNQRIEKFSMRNIY